MDSIEQLEAELDAAITRQREILASLSASTQERLDALGATIAAQNRLHAARTRQAQTTTRP